MMGGLMVGRVRRGNGDEGVWGKGMDGEGIKGI